jgi:hypothetical protein
MTGTYDWNPMPHVLEVRCPDCRRPATFEFAEVVRIRRKGEIPLFQKHRLLEYVILDGRGAAGRWHGAIFYAGLHARGTSALRGLPDGSPAENTHCIGLRTLAFRSFTEGSLCGRSTVNPPLHFAPTSLLVHVSVPSGLHSSCTFRKRS